MIVFIIEEMLVSNAYLIDSKIKQIEYPYPLLFSYTFTIMTIRFPIFSTTEKNI
ncbi:hypothetical protein F975_01653 [Acinetobacter sp. ANC 3789]|nr:hypothetical protein F975_01653 [Acinetobacter sp. ANC 3789]